MNTFFHENIEIKKNDIPCDVLFILKKLKEEGFLSFLVGGCVRDLLYKKPGKDWDIVTDARPDQIKKVFSGFKTLMIGKIFQTVTLVLDGRIYQISTFRKNRDLNFELYQGNELNLLIEDLILRDFRINAMAWNQYTGLLDPTNGLQDLRRKIVQSLDPDSRFKEDPVRMLRAIRIACELKFTISITIKRSIIKYAFLIHRISPERIREEICSILKSPDARRGILLLRRYGLERHIFSMDSVKKELLSKQGMKQISLSGFDDFKEDLSVQLALWGRLYFGSCQVARILYLPVIKHLRFKKKITDRVKILLSREWRDIDFSSSVKIRFLIAQFGRENTELMMSLKEILLLSENDISQKNKLKMEKKLLDKELIMNNPVKLTDLAINGDDLIKMGLSEGEEIGDVLRIVLKKVLIHPDNNHKDYLVKCAQDIINKIKYQRSCQ